MPQSCPRATFLDPTRQIVNQTQPANVQKNLSRRDPLKIVAVQVVVAVRGSGPSGGSGGSGPGGGSGGSGPGNFGFLRGC